MKKFETGKIYEMVSPCDSECIWRYKIMKRTASTITIKSLGWDGRPEVRTCRVSKKVSEYFGEEIIYPLGKYSLCPSLNAAR